MCRSWPLSLVFASVLIVLPISATAPVFCFKRGQLSVTRLKWERFCSNCVCGFVALADLRSGRPSGPHDCEAREAELAAQPAQQRALKLQDLNLRRIGTPCIFPMLILVSVFNPQPCMDEQVVAASGKISLKSKPRAPLRS